MPQIRPITDLRNTTEISELCHAKREPIFITKNGYGDLVIMSMETYETITAGDRGESLPEPSGDFCFLTEKDTVWAGMLADILAQHRIPFVKESSLGAGMAIKTGALLETIRFFVPASCLAAAKELVEELFAAEEAQQAAGGSIR